MRPALAMVLTVAILSFAACGDDSGGGDDSPAAEETTSEPSVAEKLATIQEGSPVDPSDPLVRRFDRALDALARKCKARRIRVSDYTVRAQELLRDAGLEESLDSIITNVNKSIPREALGGPAQTSSPRT